MPVDLIKRAEVGAPITAEQHDENMTNIESAINAAEARIDASLDENGKFKPGSLDDVAAIVDHLITLVKLTAGTAKSFLVSDVSGDVTTLTGTDGQLVGFGTDNFPAALNPEDVFESASGIFLYDNPVNRVNQTSTQAAWQTLDLTVDIAALAATGATAVVLQLEAYVDPQAKIADGIYSVTGRVTSDNATSTASSDTHRARALMYGEPSQDFPGASDTVQVIVLLDGNNVYWNTTFANAPVNSYFKMWVVGFLKA